MEGNSLNMISSCLGQFLTSLFLKTSSKGNFTASSGTEGLLQVRDVLLPALLFQTPGKGKATSPFHPPEGQTG